MSTLREPEGGPEELDSSDGSDGTSGNSRSDRSEGAAPSDESDESDLSHESHSRPPSDQAELAGPPGSGRGPEESDPSDSSDSLDKSDRGPAGSDGSDGTSGNSRSDKSHRSEGAAPSDESDESDLSDGSDSRPPSDQAGRPALPGKTSDQRQESDSSAPQSDLAPPLLPKHGGYRRLRSFQAAELVYDATVIFCDRFIPRQSRTRDQMLQAARSGRQNIAEGSMASATSKKSELKLTNVAKASLEELLLDYEDFLRQGRLPVWKKDSPQALQVRTRFRRTAAPSVEIHALDTASPEAAANTVICLIHQATFLLRRQLLRLEDDFLKQGGFSERLHRSRTDFRSKTRVPTTPDQPQCPECGRLMVLRTARRGPKAGQSFWGCSAYPSCTAIRPIGQT